MKDVNHMLSANQSVFVLVDVQGKLARTVTQSDAVLDHLKQLIQGLKVLDIPVIWLEQYPEGLSPTIEEISAELKDNSPIPKITFNACENQQFMREIKATGRSQVIIAGLEAHVCVYQTAKGLKQLGYDVSLVKDAVSSRTESNRQIGISAMEQAGVKDSSVEMALYELMERADTQTFKRMLDIVK